MAGPAMGDRLSGALHSAYDGRCDMPDDFLVLLAKLDRIERKPN